MVFLICSVGACAVLGPIYIWCIEGGGGLSQYGVCIFLTIGVMVLGHVGGSSFLFLIGVFALFLGEGFSVSYIYKLACPISIPDW